MANHKVKTDNHPPALPDIERQDLIEYPTEMAHLCPVDDVNHRSTIKDMTKMSVGDYGMVEEAFLCQSWCPKAICLSFVVD